MLSSASASTGAVILLGVPNSDTYTQACSPPWDAVQWLAAPRYHAWALDQHMLKPSFHIAAHTGEACTHLEAASGHTMRFFLRVAGCVEEIGPDPFLGRFNSRESFPQELAGIAPGRCCLARR